MNIKWLGHSCFLITSSDGTRILTDPFDNQVGYPVPNEKADIVTTSHGHFDHANVGAVIDYEQHFRDTGLFRYKDVEIKGIESFHDEKGGAARGKNIIFTYTIDGITICHLGDLGHTLTELQIAQIGHVDVLLIPVGGVYTIDSIAAVKVIEAVSPEISIPMHYKTEPLLFELDGVEKFLSQKDGKKLQSNEISIDKTNISEFSGVIALNYN